MEVNRYIAISLFRIQKALGLVPSIIHTPKISKNRPTVIFKGANIKIRFQIFLLISKLSINIEKYN